MSDAIEMYAWMALTRAFDDQMVAMWKQGRGLGGAFSQRGHEAISVGAGLALEPDDVVAPMHRDLGTYLIRRMSPERILGNMLGRAIGASKGRDANLHGVGDLDLGIIGFVSHLPQALPTTLGVAMAFKYRDERRAAMTFIGDGGTTSGAFHETLNMAGLWRAPFVLVVENNQFLDLGLEPTTLETGLLTEIVDVARKYAFRVDRNRIPALSAWTRDIEPTLMRDPEGRKLKLA